MRDTAIVWFRNDLRLEDNEALVQAAANAELVVPVYVFDERVFLGRTSVGLRKTNIYRTQFIVESVADLRNNLREKGSELIVRVGKPEIVIQELALQYKASWVFCNRERTYEEVKVQDALERNIWEAGAEVFYTRGKMLYYTADLPFPILHTPDTFSSFRKEVERLVAIRKPLPPPTLTGTKHPEMSNPGEIPTLVDLGFEQDENQDLKESKFKGGETAALQQLQHFIWDSDALRTYKDTRNQFLSWEYSSKLSPWLSLGCLSPKTVYYEVKRYENSVTKNESTYWIIFELLWRDYFRLVGKKYENRIFKLTGTNDRVMTWIEDKELFTLWCEGRTGIPFVDANMRQLLATGFMSNRGRQNVASFLTKDLKINWLWGAEFFESYLLDYDPCSNYGNWAYIAGVGQDLKEDRYFNVITQGQKYDPNGEFIKHWVPELKKLPSDLIHYPHNMTPMEMEKYQFNPERDYSLPVVELQD